MKGELSARVDMQKAEKNFSFSLACVIFMCYNVRVIRSRLRGGREEIDMRTEVLLEDIGAFIPAWDGEWTPDARMLDFEEKWEAFHTAGGRLMTCAHRGDRNEIYPENSIEGFLSVILAGADILEVDIHTTKDGQLVIMHDDTLTRTTNVTAIRESGETWLPTGDEIRNWTLSEIRRLRLVTVEGVLTEYAVPTLDELIKIAKGRVFITLDKAYDFSWEDGVIPLIEKHKAYRTVLIPYNYPLERAYGIQRDMFRRYGLCAPYFARSVREHGIMDTEGICSAVAFLAEHKMPPALRGGEYNPEDREALSPTISPLKGNHRIYAETLRAVHDNREHWEQMLEIGYNIIMGNRIYELLRFTKEKYFM